VGGGDGAGWGDGGSVGLVSRGGFGVWGHALLGLVATRGQGLAPIHAWRNRICVVKRDAARPWRREVFRAGGVVCWWPLSQIAGCFAANIAA
jgi:hypothetical protein